MRESTWVGSVRVSSLHGHSVWLPPLTRSWDYRPHTTNLFSHSPAAGIENCDCGVVNGLVLPLRWRQSSERMAGQLWQHQRRQEQCKPS